MSKDRLVGFLSPRQSFLETRMVLLCQRALPGQWGPPTHFPGLFSICCTQTDLLLSHQRPETLVVKTCWRQVTFYSCEWPINVCKTLLSAGTPKPSKCFQSVNILSAPQSLWEHRPVTLAISQPVTRKPTLNQSWTSSPLAFSCQIRVGSTFSSMRANKVTSIFPFLSAHSILGRESR